MVNITLRCQVILTFGFLRKSCFSYAVCAISFQAEVGNMDSLCVRACVCLCLCLCLCGKYLLSVNLKRAHANTFLPIPGHLLSLNCSVIPLAVSLFTYFPPCPQSDSISAMCQPLSFSVSVCERVCVCISQPDVMPMLSDCMLEPRGALISDTVFPSQTGGNSQMWNLVCR